MTIDAAFTDFPTLSTKRLRLREIRPDDAKTIFAIYSDEETMRYYGDLVYQSLAEAEAYIIVRRDDYTRRREIRWGITRQEDDRIIGTCGFHHFPCQRIKRDRPGRRKRGRER